MRKRQRIHPFPARMASELAIEAIEKLSKPGGVVLDPMCGSGTVPKLAALTERRAIACDFDPLAVMMTRTACKPGWVTDLENRASLAVKEAEGESDRLPRWIEADTETRNFVEYWFAIEQRRALSRLARVLADRPRSDDPLRLALSRLIITKEGGASLARDTAHSRPHRVRQDNDFDVMRAFTRAAAKIQVVLQSGHVEHRPSVRRSDARKLSFVARSSVDLVVTSPPYLNAIDYMRGHRMSLVWLGHVLHDLRMVRAESIGAERGLEARDQWIHELLRDSTSGTGSLEGRDGRMVARFITDMNKLCRSLARVTKPAGHIVLVVANSQVRGVPVSNATITRRCAERNGFYLVDDQSRELPSKHRYLPPPSTSTGTLGTRMKTEHVLTLRRQPD